MDPNACLERLCDAWNQSDGDELGAAIDDLTGWLDKGGSAPTVTHNQLLSLLSMAREAVSTC